MFPITSRIKLVLIVMELNIIQKWSIFLVESVIEYRNVDNACCHFRRLGFSFDCHMHLVYNVYSKANIACTCLYPFIHLLQHARWTRYSCLIVSVYNYLTQLFKSGYINLEQATNLKPLWHDEGRKWSVLQINHLIILSTLNNYLFQTSTLASRPP